MKKAGFRIIENEWIPLPDGRRLAARIWLPKNASKEPVPAILEYLPYRKRDGTAQRDESTYPTFAEAGYAGVRVDIAGTGESDGEYDDEYSPRELQDACDAIEWIASRDWCSGQLGMMGISWGGFNSLQVAALKPAALKAIISVGSSVDRYNDDIHYKNGCLLYSNFSWSSTMLSFTSRPPDPELVGKSWKETWMKRLKTQPFPLELWLAHQHRDSYWKHGSINENYAAIETPTLIISGWADGYLNAPPAAAINFECITKAVNGPWIHKYPHLAWPKPRMDFLQEALRWWDHWLKNVDNGVEKLPAYRAYISENVRPMLRREFESGRWVSESKMPSAEIKRRQYYLSPNRQLLELPGYPKDLSVCTPQNCGTSCGEIFSLKPEGELPGDQRRDDAGSLIFDTVVLHQPIEILGRPKMRLKVTVDQPVGNLVARLNDMHPDGTATRVSWGVINLAHRNGNENPLPMTPGSPEIVEFDLNECGYKFLPGHRIRIAVSTTYWPMIMPPPANLTATIKLGSEASVSLPIRSGGDKIVMQEPDNPDPLPTYEKHSPELTRRWIERDLQTGDTHYHVIDDSGEIEIPGHGLHTRDMHEDCWSIAANNPLSYHSTSKYTTWMHRGDWSIRTESESSLRCDAANFYISATVTAFESDEQINQRSWEKVIPRNLV